MKAIRHDLTKVIQFKPYSLVITIESRKEEKVLYKLFNTPAITDRLYDGGIDVSKIRDCFRVRHSQDFWSGMA
jgi:hypothetical protein